MTKPYHFDPRDDRWPERMCEMCGQPFRSPYKRKRFCNRENSIGLTCGEQRKSETQRAWRERKKA